MNEWTLLTGASSGIGRELARLFAADRFNLTLVARNGARLNQLATELRAEHGIEVKVLVKDLSAANAPRELFDALRDTPVSVLVNNAGIGAGGAFADTGLQTSLDVMRVNMDALVQLTHLFVQPMLKRRAGRILNVASTAAFQPGPTMNVYYASKAFVYSFSYALAVELEDSGVTATALCPGTTRTEFFERAKIDVAGAWPMMDAGRVAAAGYRGLMQGRRVVIPGLSNKIAAALAKRMPEWLTVGMLRRLHKRRAT
jgi:uncharacterized protein